MNKYINIIIGILKNKTIVKIFKILVVFIMLAMSLASGNIDSVLEGITKIFILTT